MKIETKELALAAYIKVNGGKLVGLENRKFIFETEGTKTITDWGIEYSNTCCYSCDRELVTLRNLLGSAGNQ